LAGPRRLPGADREGQAPHEGQRAPAHPQPDHRARRELADERELPQAFPETLGTHAGKRTAASYLIEAGYDIGWVMDQLGHADGRLTMAVYRQSRRRRKDPRVRELCGRPSSKR
jgi:integrase